MKLPSFKFENPLWREGFAVIGIDEVGRGAFAGPVGVGGVVFNPKMSLKDKKTLLNLGINDSKKLSANKRLELSKIIKDNCLAYDVCFIDVSVINKIGVGKAGFLGMEKVAKKLFEKVKNPYLLIDAFEIPNVSFQQKGIIGGDSLSISIAAASIIAKVERDRFMEKLAVEFPRYFWNKNKGYGTLIHRKAISKFGLSVFHRPDFCRNVEAGLLF